MLPRIFSLSLTLIGVSVGGFLLVARLPQQFGLSELPKQYVNLSGYKGAQLNDSLDSSHTVRETVRVKRVIDGDTVELKNGDRLRLLGIDAPEQGTCYAKEAADVLASFVEDTDLQLEQGSLDKDQYGRRLGYLYSGSLFVNYELVRMGAVIAKPFPPDVLYEDLFVGEQGRAKAAHRGLWGLCGEFQESPLIDLENQTQSAPSLSCTVKGDINEVGERLYYTSTCRGYEPIIIDVRAGERWFCSTEEAEFAGWRKAKECP